MQQDSEMQCTIDLFVIFIFINLFIILAHNDVTNWTICHIYLIHLYIYFSTHIRYKLQDSEISLFSSIYYTNIDLK